MASVLLIESEAPLVRLMAWFLLEAGFEVSKATDPDQALESAAQSVPDVIVFNTSIPLATKAACIESVRKVSPSSRVIDVTESRSNGTVPEAVVDRVLRLPFHADEFIEAVGDLSAK